MLCGFSRFKINNGVDMPLNMDTKYILFVSVGVFFILFCLSSSFNYSFYIETDTLNCRHISERGVYHGDAYDFALFVCNSRGILAYNLTSGDVLWKYTISATVTSVFISAESLNNTELIYIFVGSSDGWVYKIDKDGSLVSKVFCGDISAISYITMQDVDRDSIKEILILNSNKKLFIAEQNLTIIYERVFPVYVHYSIPMVVTTQNFTLKIVLRSSKRIVISDIYGGSVIYINHSVRLTSNVDVVDRDSDGIADLLIYGDERGYIFFASLNGSVIWKKNIAGKITWIYAITNGYNKYMYISDYNGNIFFMDYNGTIVMEKQISGILTQAPLILYDKKTNTHIFTVMTNNKRFLIFSDKGEEIFQGIYGSFSAPAAFFSNKKILIVNKYGVIHKLIQRNSGSSFVIIREFNPGWIDAYSPVIKSCKYMCESGLGDILCENICEKYIEKKDVEFRQTNIDEKKDVGRDIDKDVSVDITSMIRGFVIIFFIYWFWKGYYQKTLGKSGNK